MRREEQQSKQLRFSLSCCRLAVAAACPWGRPSILSHRLHSHRLPPQAILQCALVLPPHSCVQPQCVAVPVELHFISPDKPVFFISPCTLLSNSLFPFVSFNPSRKERHPGNPGSLLWITSKFLVTLSLLPSLLQAAVLLPASYPASPGSNPWG